MQWMYVATSSLVRLSGIDATRPGGLADIVDRHLDAGGKLVSSQLLTLEVRRVAVRISNSGGDPTGLMSHYAAVTALRTLDKAVMQRAWSITQNIKTLDSIHLATCALLAQDGLDVCLLTSDKAMASVGHSLGLTVVAG